jgi:hypothetical protein
VRAWGLLVGALALAVVVLVPSFRPAAEAPTGTPAIVAGMSPGTLVTPAPKPRPAELALVAAAVLLIAGSAIPAVRRRKPTRLLWRRARHVSLRGPPCLLPA